MGRLGYPTLAWDDPGVRCAQELAANDPYVTTQDCGYIWYNSTGLRTPDMVTDGMHPTLLGTQARTPRFPAGYDIVQQNTV